jgi:hypothetical protein
VDSRIVLRLRSVSPFIPTGRDYSGSAAALEEEAVKATFSSPPRCRTVSPMAYGSVLPTVGRRRASPVMAGTLFSRRLHVAPSWSAPGNPHHRVRGERLGLSSALRLRAVSGAPARPKMPSPGVTLPGPFVAMPSPELPVAPRWLRTSAGSAEFEQGVLYGCGPAQVGFGDRLSSFHRLTLSSGGRLSPEPLRLTRPFRAKSAQRRAAKPVSVTHTCSSTWGRPFNIPPRACRASCEPSRPM